MTYSGTPASMGVAIGKAYLYQRFQPQLHDWPPITPEADISQYEVALAAAQRELEALRDRFLRHGDEEKAGIFSAHLEILLDEVMDEEIRTSINERVCNGPQSIRMVYDQYADMFSKLDDPLIRERALDLRDVCARLLRCWDGLPEQNLSALPGPVIVVAHDLLPSDTATLDRENVLGIVTEIGGTTSHSAIIARSYEIPAVLGIENICTQLSDGQEVILDAVTGELLTEFNEVARNRYRNKREEVLREMAVTKTFLGCEPVTPDGIRMTIELNVASSDPSELMRAQYTDGVGLFRSEFLYMGRKTLPSEEEQYRAYRKVLLAYGQRPVILRTLDIGGDKPLESMELPVEDNPFLGNRALRLCFQNPQLFKTQLRAALRASVHGNLWLMFPMVSSMDDIRRAKTCFQKACLELDVENIPYSKTVKLGIMIEVPSIALLADLAAEEVDFASIGTNDLTQYSTAVDRGNPAVKSYYQTYHPALFRLIGYVVEQFQARGKPVGVCGEMGGNPHTAAVLMGLGIRQLSMGASAIAGIKRMVVSTSCRKAQEIAQVVKHLSTAEEVERYLMEHVILSSSLEE